MFAVDIPCVLFIYLWLPIEDMKGEKKEDFIELFLVGGIKEYTYMGMIDCIIGF